MQSMCVSTATPRGVKNVFIVSCFLLVRVQVILTPAAAKGSGMVAKAEELATKHGYFYLNQFVTQANPDMHERTTGAEIVQDFKGQRLDYWVTGYGTGGTFQGAGKTIKAARPDVKVNHIFFATGVDSSCFFMYGAERSL